ncbi:MAG: hypothetical protein ACOC5D_05040 [Thermoplasmatota archaeon]
MGIIALTLALRRFDIFWLTLGAISFLLMLALERVNESYYLKTKLIILLLFPLFLGMSGISQGIEDLLFGVDIAFILITPTLGFIIMLNLHNYTSFKTNLHFALFFVTIFSLAVGAFIGIGEYLSDQYFGTVFLESNYDLMIDLLSITIFSGTMGIVFKNYLKDPKYNTFKSIDDSFEFDSEKTGKTVTDLLLSGFGKKDHKWAPLFSRLIQIVIIVFSMYALYEGNIRWFFTAVLSFSVTMVPYIFTRDMNIVIPPILNLWICAALFFHVLGGIRGYYDYLWWWDNFTHFLSAALISILGFTVLLTINQLSDSIHITSNLIPIILLLFILATGVVWEIFELFSDILFGTNMQYSLADTVQDLMFNAIGAVFAATIGYKYFPSKYWQR